MNYDILHKLAKLAKSDKYQILYNQCKEISGLQLFNNKTDLSYLQVTFLYMLSIYSMLYNDLYSGEEYISEEVINDLIRTEAYLLLRKELKEKRNLKKSNQNTIDTVSGLGSVIFRRKGK